MWRNEYGLESFLLATGAVLLSRNRLQVKHPERRCPASNLREKKASLSQEEWEGVAWLQLAPQGRGRSRGGELAWPEWREKAECGRALGDVGGTNEEGGRKGGSSLPWPNTFFLRSPESNLQDQDSASSLWSSA